MVEIAPRSSEEVARHTVSVESSPYLTKDQKLELLRRKIKYVFVLFQENRSFPFQEEGEMEAAFITHNCSAIMADVSQLAYERIAFRSMAKDFEILPEVIAKDPLAPPTGQTTHSGRLAALRRCMQMWQQTRSRNLGQVVMTAPDLSRRASLTPTTLPVAMRQLFSEHLLMSSNVTV